MAEYIEREALEKALTAAAVNDKDKNRRTWAKAICILHDLPAADVEKMSDGYHTFADLYEQRLILSAALAKNNPHAWKSKRHEDGSVPFGGGWFIMGFDTDEGCYTYHYELKDWDLFQCEELDKGKPWDGHTSKDVRRLLSIPAADVAPVQEWISVKDRLPDLIPCNVGTAYSEAVIAWTSGRKAMIAVWDGIDWIAPFDYWEAWGEEITHWMPLPELPKGE